jgi:hypothetical protein
MMAVLVSTTPVFQSAPPQAMFNTDMVDTGIRTGPMSWDIAPDGKRFLIINDKSQGTSSLNVILNWRPRAVVKGGYGGINPGVIAVSVRITDSSLPSYPLMESPVVSHRDAGF